MTDCEPSMVKAGHILQEHGVGRFQETGTVRGGVDGVFQHQVGEQQERVDVLGKKWRQPQGSQSEPRVATALNPRSTILY